MIKIILITSIAIIPVVVSQNCEKGDFCRTHEDNAGVVREIKDCKYFLKSYKRRKILKICGYSVSNPLVCCPQHCTSFGDRPKHKELETKITMGNPSEVAEFPHFAQLGSRDVFDEISFKCGGALISTEFVLTAAHCFIGSKETRVSMVRLGKVKFKNKYFL